MYKRMIGLLFLFPLLLTAAEISFTVDNPGKIKGKRIIRVAVPFPAGKFRTADDFGVFEAQKQFPAEMTVLNRWPLDQSLRWISATFEAELSGAPQQKFLLKTGVRPLRPRRSTFYKNFLYKPYFITASGVRYEAGKPEKTTIVESNALRQMIKTEGFFRNSKNEPFCRWIIRQEFKAGESESKLYFTFVITGDEKSSRFQDIGIEFPGKFKKGAFGGFKGDAMNKYLLQYEYDKYLVASRFSPAQWQKTGYGKHAPGWAAADNFRISVEDFAETFPNELEIRPDAVVYHFWPAHGVKNPEFKVTDANRQYLRYCHEGKVLDFTAPEKYWNVGNKRIHRYFKEGRIESPMGVAKTAILRVDPQGGARTVEADFLALVDPVWLCASGVLRKIHHYDPEQFPEEEKFIYSYYALERHLSRTTTGGDFGKWNYGDSHTWWNPELKRWDDFYRTWKGYHHSSGSFPWLLALRKGDFELCRWAIDVSLHLMDIDICNWSDGAPVSKDPKLLWRTKVKGALNDYKGLSHWHAGSRNPDYNSQTEFAILYTYITGDPRGLDVAKMWGETALKRTYWGLYGRQATGTISALTDLWLATGDKRYQKLIETQLANMAKVQVKKNQPLSAKVHEGGFLGWPNYQPGIQKYYEATGSPVAAAILKKWAKNVVGGRTFRSDAMMVDLPIYGWLLTKESDYLRYAQWFKESGMALTYASPTGQHLLNSFHHFFLERLPFWMWMKNRCKKEITPLAPGNSCSQFPYAMAGGTYPKEGNYTIFLKSDGKPFELKCGLTIGKPGKGTAELLGPDGKILWKKELKPAKKKTVDFSQKFSKVPAGVLTLKIGPAIRAVAMECRLPRVARPEVHYNQNYGCSTWAFRIPATGTLVIEAERVMNISANLQLESPEKKCAGIFRFPLPFRHRPGDPVRKTASFKVTPGIWELRGFFGTSKFTLKFNGKKIPYVAPGKEFWFDKE